MASTGWVKRETMEALADWGRMRNALVHRYENVSVADFHTQLLASGALWRAYLAQVLTNLQS